MTPPESKEPEADAVARPARTAADPCDGTHPEPACPSDQCHLKAEGATSSRKSRRKLAHVVNTGPTQPLIVNTGPAQPLIVDSGAVVNVRDHGAVGDASTDDTAAIESAIEATSPPETATVDAPAEVETARFETLDAAVAPLLVAERDAAIDGFIEVAPGLYCGGPVESAAAYPGVGIIILCAAELQPELPAFKGTIVRAALSETLRPTKQELENAAVGATLAYDELVRGGRVIVSCSDGRSRAALIAGLVLGKRLVAQDVVTLLRRSLGEHALSNATFHRIVWQTAMVANAGRAAAGAVTPVSVPVVIARDATAPARRGRGQYGPRQPAIPQNPAKRAGS